VTRRLGMGLVGPGFVGAHHIDAVRRLGFVDVVALCNGSADYVMSTEHEDGLASVDEGLRAAVELLHRVVLTKPPATPWWT
jgi:hypothetical protein